MVDPNIHEFTYFATSTEKEILLITGNSIQKPVNGKCINTEESKKNQKKHFHVIYIWGTVKQIRQEVVSRMTITEQCVYVCESVCAYPLIIYSGINYFHSNADLDAVLHL